MFESKKVTIKKTTTTNEKPKKEEPYKGPIEVLYQVQEELEMAIEKKANTIYNRYGIRFMAKTRRSRHDAKVTEKALRENLSVFSSDYIGIGETKPIGAIHARIVDMAIEASNMERKGMRGTIKVKIEHYTNDSKDTRIEYKNIYPCDCIADLVGDIADSIAGLVYDEAHRTACLYNEQLEKDNNGKCKCKKCPNS